MRHSRRDLFHHRRRGRAGGRRQINCLSMEVQTKVGKVEKEKVRGMTVVYLSGKSSRKDSRTHHGSVKFVKGPSHINIIGNNEANRLADQGRFSHPPHPVSRQRHNKIGHARRPHPSKGGDECPPHTWSQFQEHCLLHLFAGPRSYICFSVVVQQLCSALSVQGRLRCCVVVVSWWRMVCVNHCTASWSLAWYASCSHLSTSITGCSCGVLRLRFRVCQVGAPTMFRRFCGVSRGM